MIDQQRIAFGDEEEQWERSNRVPLVVPGNEWATTYFKAFVQCAVYRSRLWLRPTIVVPQGNVPVVWTNVFRVAISTWLKEGDAAYALSVAPKASGDAVLRSA